MNDLYELRKDLAVIKEVMKLMNYHNRWNSHGPDYFFKTSKKEAIEEGCKVIKRNIIELAAKYKKERGTHDN